MSSLQVDSISSIGGGQVDGTGKVIQFKEAVNTTPTVILDGETDTILTLDFTPKFLDSIILCQGFHSQDACGGTESNYCNSYIFAGSIEVARASAVGYKISKAGDARFTYSYSGTTPSWGTTPLDIDLKVAAGIGDWTVSRNDLKTSLFVWEIAK